MKNVRIILIFLAGALLGRPAANAQTYNEDVTLTTQAEVNDFGANYTAISETLRIEESSPGGISNLDALSGLTEVGDLEITNNEALEIIHLPNLSRVYGVTLNRKGGILISNNPSLKSINFPILSQVDYYSAEMKSENKNRI